MAQWRNRPANPNYPACIQLDLRPLVPPSHPMRHSYHKIPELTKELQPTFLKAKDTIQELLNKAKLEPRVPPSTRLSSCSDPKTAKSSSATKTWLDNYIGGRQVPC